MYWTEEMMQSGRKTWEQNIYYEYGSGKTVTAVTRRQPRVFVTCVKNKSVYILGRCSIIDGRLTEKDVFKKCK